MAKWIKSFFKSFLFLSALTVGVGLLYAWNDRIQLKKAKKEHYHVHLLDGWEMIGGLNDDAVIEVGNREEDAYIVGIPYAKINYENSEKFYQYLMDYIKNLYADYKLIGSTKMTIDRHEAYELTGTLMFEEISYRNYVYGITYDDCYLLVMAWAPADAKEELFAQMQQIVSTVHKV